MQSFSLESISTDLQKLDVEITENNQELKKINHTLDNYKVEWNALSEPIKRAYSSCIDEWLKYLITQKAALTRLQTELTRLQTELTRLQTILLEQQYGIKGKLKLEMTKYVLEQPIVFKCDNSKQISNQDLSMNNIFETFHGTVEPELVEEFKNRLNQKRVVNFCTNEIYQTAVMLLRIAKEALGVGADHVFQNVSIELIQDTLMTPKSEMNSMMEVLQYFYVAKIYSLRTNHVSLSEMASTANFVSRVVDDSLDLSNLEYNRDVECMYPLNFQTPTETFHVHTRIDGAFDIQLGIHAIQVMALGLGSKKNKTQENALFEDDYVKLCLMSVLNLKLLKRLTIQEPGAGHSIPFLITSRNLYTLYLVYCNQGNFMVRQMYHYYASDLSQMALLVFHLRNLSSHLPKIHLLSDQSTVIKKRISIFQRELGHSLASLRSLEATSGETGSTDPDSMDVDGSVARSMRLQYRLEDYSLVILDHPNIHRATRKLDGETVVVKMNATECEVNFLRLLTSAPHRDHPSNKTVQVLDIFPWGKDYRVVMPEVMPFVNSLGERLNLLPQQWKLLAEKLKDHVKFLHDLRICHRDIKPQNLAVDSRGDLVVLDVGLMESYPQSSIVRDFSGTRDYSLPAYYDNPSLGFDAFELEMHSLEKTIEWMVGNF